MEESPDPAAGQPGLEPLPLEERRHRLVDLPSGDAGPDLPECNILRPPDGVVHLPERLRRAALADRSRDVGEVAGCRDAGKMSRMIPVRAWSGPDPPLCGSQAASPEEDDRVLGDTAALQELHVDEPLDPLRCERLSVEDGASSGVGGPDEADRLSHDLFDVPESLGDRVDLFGRLDRPFLEERLFLEPERESPFPQAVGVLHGERTGNEEALYAPLAEEHGHHVRPSGAPERRTGPLFSIGGVGEDRVGAGLRFRGRAPGRS